ncbi:RICIN domain-containing protein [Streptomyces coerulescens]|uniref:RICIN domain-containing protein n=1 Tax=Streptomyces coerulescens TaxID=29304 RepID=A0ABW0CZ71_STRCD
MTRLVETPTPTPTLTPTPTPTPQVPKAADTTRLRIKSTDQCMETSGNSGAQPREAGCNDTAGQTWELVRNANGHVQLRNQASKLCLTYPDQRPDGAVVRQLACDEDTTTQWWEYYKVESETIAFSLSGDNGRRLGLNDWHAAGKGEPHSSTIASRSTTTTRPHWSSSSMENSPSEGLHMNAPNTPQDPVDRDSRC